MSLDSIFSLGQSALELGLITSLTVLALFLSYSMLNVCDLSTDGCFTLGATVGAVVAIAGHPYLSIAAAMAAGIASGFITAILQTKMGINSLLAGIIVNTGLYSINIAVMSGSSILNMNKTDTVFTKMAALVKGTPVARQSKLFVAIIAVAAVAVILGLFLIIGLCVANSFTALSGCLLAQSQRSVNIDIGTGMVTIALASLLIGGVFLGRKKMPLRIFGMVLGAFIFRLIYTIALRFDMPAFMLKFVSSVIVITAIATPYFKKQLPLLKRRIQTRSGRRKADA